MENKKLLNNLISVFQLIEEFNKKDFSENYSELNMSDVHSIDFIGKTQNPNITSLSKYMNFTKSGALKIVKKLLEKGYIEQFQSINNKKEKYFTLTEKGKEIFKKHKILHKEAEKRDSKIFQNFSDTEKEIISKFLKLLEIEVKEKLSKY
ncbi:MAG: winged helix DNA-binding protein [Fusobacterium perfoetens]|uniref:winged helix DNA-binding protein n=1 Tax=Fusobacterium perfoetens TaxID=852 RepID=UPI0023F3F29D|nr:winged helix DNA-binding protein [Fusobacterium perfoetens]MCI6152684.1 winged helix DNA-binding protein [Fusobacterium perfoetens]MDY3237664.1 winged helix DNA-binding protein [Fusobacterium perfoetens]